MRYYTTDNRATGAIALRDIPEVAYAEFYADVVEKLADTRYHLAHYFALPLGEHLRFFCLLLDDQTSQVLITSHLMGYYEEQALPSLTARHAQVHPFERDIAERFGVRFDNMPWDKPLRTPFDRFDRGREIDNYPFYTMRGGSLHEVNVGPIHAGIIEPGAFRFICNGEEVLHLEIALGYQHRGVEHALAATDNRLRQMCIAETIAGDSAVAHATAFALAVEKLAGHTASPRLEAERAVALELERMAMQIADTGALCMDVAYQLGQVACEALRTVVINTTQAWCGNRFGKGLIRPAGTHFPLTAEKTALIRRNIAEVARRFDQIRHDLKSSPTVLARFEQCGIVQRDEMLRIGGVGQAARAGGVARDVRVSHPWGVFGRDILHESALKEQGDVMARLTVRCNEVLQSAAQIEALLAGVADAGLGADVNKRPISDRGGHGNAGMGTGAGADSGRDSGTNTLGYAVSQPHEDAPGPDYSAPLAPESLAFGLVEGWRGETLHVLLTDAQGRIAACRVKDASLHNWLALALAVRGEGISDFPICNKSFNLSYCGHDL